MRGKKKVTLQKQFQCDQYTGHFKKINKDKLGTFLKLLL